MEYIVTRTIPTTELKEHKDYVGFLFKNENGVYNICQTLEDVIKTNQWFKNLPLHAIIVTDEKPQVGDTFLAAAVNEELNGKTFKFLGYTEDAIDLIDLMDKDGKKIISTKHLLDKAYKFIRLANHDDKMKLVNGVINKITF